VYIGTISEVHNIFGKYPVKKIALNMVSKTCKNGNRMSLNTTKCSF
jgi:hypothetical protein